MKKSLNCISIGSSLLDTFVRLKTTHRRVDKESICGDDECFPLGSKIEVSQIFQQSGGGATNSATTFARQGLKGLVISKVGDDLAAKLILHELEQENIPSNLISKISGAKTGQSVVLVDPSAERTILTDHGTSGELTAKDLQVLDDFAPLWVYVTGLNGSAQALDFIWDWASHEEVKICWDPGVADLALPSNKLNTWAKKVELLLLNRSEANVFLGTDKKKGIELASMMDHLGVKRAAVTDGQHPLALLDHGKCWQIVPRVIKAVDQTGAGDAFGSGLISGLLKGVSFKDSIEFGLVNAENVVMHFGAKTGILYRH